MIKLTLIIVYASLIAKTLYYILTSLFSNLLYFTIFYISLTDFNFILTFLLWLFLLVCPSSQIRLFQGEELGDQITLDQCPWEAWDGLDVEAQQPLKGLVITNGSLWTKYGLLDGAVRNHSLLFFKVTCFDFELPQEIFLMSLQQKSTKFLINLG